MAGQERIQDLRGRKSQAQIAQEAGFINANVISLLKSGANKIPLDRVPDLARALEVDPARFMRLAIEQAIGPIAAKAVLSAFGTPISENELLWIGEIREASGDTDPRPTAKGRAAIRALFGK